jgi:hypothetical protein
VSHSSRNVSSSTKKFISNSPSRSKKKCNEIYGDGDDEETIKVKERRNMLFLYHPKENFQLAINEKTSNIDEEIDHVRNMEIVNNLVKSLSVEIDHLYNNKEMGNEIGNLK